VWVCSTARKGLHSFHPLTGLKSVSMVSHYAKHSGAERLSPAVKYGVTKNFIQQAKGEMCVVTPRLQRQTGIRTQSEPRVGHECRHTSPVCRTVVQKFLNWRIVWPQKT